MAKSVARDWNDVYQKSIKLDKIDISAILVFNMAQENFDKTRVEPELEVLSAEQILRERDEKIRQREEMIRLNQMKRDRAAQEDAERLRAIRAHLGSTEEGMLKSRQVVQVSEDQLQQVQREIAIGQRVLESAKSGILTKGDVDRDERPVVAKEYASSPVAAPVFEGAEDVSHLYQNTEGAAARRRRIALARLKELHGEAAVERDIHDLPETVEPPKLTLQNLPRVQAEEPAAAAPDAPDIDQIFSKIKSPSVPPPPAQNEERAA